MSLDDDPNMLRVLDLKIPRLERIFRPPGLPLVCKNPDAPQETTTLLVRGQPGTGKTTLVTALAHALATRGEGIALYLNTEALASELRYKAKLLDLPDNTLSGWPARHQAGIGALVTRHVEPTSTGREAKDPEEHHLASFRAVEAILRDAETNPAAHPPIRVVVFDGFTVPSPEDGKLDLRHEVISFLQDLEAHGVTPILVEEMGQRGLEWLPCVVDLVFELALEQDPDTGKLIRRLRCPKSRFSRCHPGPHDYGVERERPTLWPDPLDVLNTSDVDSAERPPDFIWPDTTEDRYLLLSGPGVIASYYDRQEANILRPHLHTPGTRTLKIVCGSEIDLLRDDTRVASVPESDGPYALAWAVLEHARDCNFISVGQMPGLMRRKRFRLPLLHMLEALARSGKRVCVHGAESDLATTENLGTVLLPILRHPRRTLHSMQRREFLSGIRWVDPPPELFAIAPASNEDLTAATLLEDAAGRLGEAASATDFGTRHNILTWTDATISISDPNQGVLCLSRNQPLPATLASVAHLALHQHRLGDIYPALANLAHVRRWAERVADPALHSCIGWISALLGEDWQAARTVASALRRERISSLDQLLWFCLRVTYAPSGLALDVLLTSLAKSDFRWHTQLSAAFALNAAFAIHGREESSSIGEQWIRGGFSRSHLTRLQLEADILSEDQETRAQVDRSHLFGEHREWGMLQSQELAFNLGLLSSPRHAARGYFEEALKHPLLAATARLHIDRLP